MDEYYIIDRDYNGHYSRWLFSKKEYNRRKQFIDLSDYKIVDMSTCVFNNYVLTKKGIIYKKYSDCSLKNIIEVNIRNSNYAK